MPVPGGIPGNRGPIAPKPKAPSLGAVLAHAVAPVAVGIQKTTGAKPVHVSPVIASHALTSKPAFAGGKPKAPPKYLQHVAVHAGHWVVKNGHWVPIYATSKGKWVEGFKPGAIAPPAPNTTPPKQGLSKAPAFATTPHTGPFKLAGMSLPALTEAPAFAGVPRESAALAKTQGVAASEAAIQKLLDAQRKSAGGGLHIAGITVPGTAAIARAAAGLNWGNAGHELGLLGKGIEHLPQDTVHGLWEVGKTAALHPTHLPALLNEIQKNDALAQLVQGHFKRARDLSQANPLGAVTDVAAGAGAVGRVAGLGRGALGMADLAPAERAALRVEGSGLSRNTARAAANIAPVSRRFSGNLGTALLQDALDAKNFHFGDLLHERLAQHHLAPKAKKVALRRFDREMKRRANEHQLIQNTLQEAYIHDAHTIHDRILKGDPTAAAYGKALSREQRVAIAKRQAEADAMHQTFHQNALTNQATGDIYFAPGGKTTAMKELEARGTPFVRQALPQTLAEKAAGEEVRHVIIPKTLQETLARHAALRQPVEGALPNLHRWVTNRFRRSVLPFSAKWITGNTVEATLRSALRGVGPTHVKLGHDLVKEMRNEGLNPESVRLQAQALQGTHFSMVGRHSREYLGNHPNAALRGLGSKAGKVANIAGKPADLSFKFNSTLEQQFAHGVLGKYAAKDLARIKRANPGITHAEAMKRLAHEYARPEKAAAAGRYGRQVLGQYGAFGPGASKFIHSTAPFAPWYGNSIKFLASQPVRHPIFTTSMLSAARATDKQWQKEHKSIKGLGPELGAFPMTGPKQAVDISRYLPMGAFSAGAGKDPLSAAVANFAPIVYPQYSSAALAAMGLDPFGRPLLYPGPKQKRLASGKLSKSKEHQGSTGFGHGLNALNAFLGGVSGFYPNARRAVAERGAKPYSGTDMLWDLNPPTRNQKPALNLAGIVKGLDKVFNPAHPIDLTPTHPKAKRKRPGGGGGGISIGGGGSSLFSSYRFRGGDRRPHRPLTPGGRRMYE